MASDPVAARTRMMNVLEDVIDQLPEAFGTPKNAWVRISSHDAVAAVRCPRRAVATPPDLFENRAATAARAAALDALRQQPRTPTASSTDHVHATWALMDAGNGWPWNWLTGTDEGRATAAEVAATKSRAIRHAAGVERVAGPEQRLYAWRPRWTYPGRALEVVGRPDYVSPRMAPNATAVIAFGGEPRPEDRTRLAFEATIATLQLRAPIRAAVAVYPAVGDDATDVVDVDDAVINDGVTAVHLALRARLAGGVNVATFDARPNSGCRGCIVAADCPEGHAWLAGSGTWRHGFQLPA
jgi:hypothetical protein